MPYETSSRPFSHQKNRGQWASPTDFIFACVAHSFRIDTLFILPWVIFHHVGIYALIPYFMAIVLCTLPIVFIQSFLGQFSSTGFISVFRISPLFKGIGYVSLGLNTLSLSFYSVFAGISLLFFANSLKFPLPWGCEANQDWLRKLQVINTTCSVDTVHPEMLIIPFLEYFKQNMNPETISKDEPVVFAYILILGTFAIWIIVWLVVRSPTEWIGRILKYMTLVMLSGLGICVLRFAFLPGAFTRMDLFPAETYVNSFFFVIPLALSGLGPGWGSILTMASFNSFRTNITKNTWILCLGQIGLMLLTFLAFALIESFSNSSAHHNLPRRLVDIELSQLLLVPTVIAFLEMPHLWSLLFSGALTIGATSLLIVQLLSVLTSLFDEFEKLRTIRERVICIVVVKLALGSIIYCSNHGLVFVEVIVKYSMLTQVILNLMLLLVVLWVYGRERFQRDLHFMTGRTYPTWMVFVVRYVAPMFLLLSVIVGLLLAPLGGYHNSLILYLATCAIVLPWFIIPGYCIFKLWEMQGVLGMRLKRCTQPYDWYPVDPEDRQGYEEALSHSQGTYQLTNEVEEDANLVF